MRRASSIAAVVLASVVALAACSGSKESAADNASSETVSAGAKAPKPSENTSAPATEADQSSAESVVAAWVAAVIKGEMKESCLLMADAEATPAKVGSEEICGDKAPLRKEMEEIFKSYREAFTPDPPIDDPQVKVAEVVAPGDKAEIPSDKIAVNGQSLNKIVLSHSTGVTEDELDIKVESSKIGDIWYVTNLGFHIGG